MYTNDIFGDYYIGQFRRVTLLYSNLIRQVSLFPETATVKVLAASEVSGHSCVGREHKPI